MEFDDKLFKHVENIIVDCLIYANKNVNIINDVYVYISYENSFFYNVFYRSINGKLYKKHKIDSFITDANVSTENQSKLNKKINNELIQIKDLFVEDGREVPMQIKINYKPVNGNNKIKFIYDKNFNDDLFIGDHELSDEWFEQLENGKGEIE